ncbi:MAG TPA: AgmX/PglI C-terminal domain-containing protein [Kofleriaceae bacterium]|nr:AgmX/PglI C-terminal domain-containing protein [Kofleriaceae bacterium]
MRAFARLAFVTLALTACAKKDGGGEAGSATPSANVPQKGGIPDDLAIPTLAAGSRADNVPTGPTVVATAKAIIIEGRSMVVVADGKVDPAELEGGANGLKVPRLSAWAAQWSQLPEAATSEAFLVAVDPALPSALPLQIMMSLKASKLRRFAFLVRTPDGVGTVPLELPDGPPPAPPPPANPEDTALGLVVTLTPDSVVVWSTSQLEGTMQAPRAVLKPATDAAWLTHLRDHLGEIRQRRWGGGLPRPDYQKAVIVMVDARIASGDLVNTIAAVRADAKGEALFPDVRIATGFDTPELAEATKVPEPPPPPSPDQARARDRQDAVALQEEAAAMAMALALVGESDSVEGDMSARRPGADLGAQIDAVREGGGTVAVGGGGGRGARGDGEARVGMAGDATIRGPGSGSGSGSDSDVKTPSGRITVSGKAALADTSLTVDAVLQKMLSAYMAGLKRCYKNELKKDPAMRGGVTLRLRVNESGRVFDAKASGLASELDACFEGLMVNWRFPVPKDADDEPTEGSFEIKLGLVPD